MAVSRSDVGVDHINEVVLRRTRLLLGLVTASRVQLLATVNLSRSNQLGQLSLAIPLWVDTNEYWRWSFGHYQRRQNVSTSVRSGTLHAN